MRTNLVPFRSLNTQADGDRRVVRLLEDARRRLVETGTRNRLVHVNRSAKRANVVNVVNERSDDIFDILWANAKKMTFAPLLKDAELDSDADAEDVETPQLEFIQNEGSESRFRDYLLDVRMSPDGLQKRLLRLARDAQTAEGEQGVNILYLALGFLTWFEDKTSAVKREAPLVLLPVELKRNARTSTYDLVRRDDDLATNLSLKERLQEDFGIVLPEIEDEDGWRPSVYFEKVEATIASRERWSIDRDGMQLGFFSFSKFLMLRDLDPRNWPNGGLASHAFVRGLLREGFLGDAPLFADGVKLDNRLEPAEIIQVIDADASQTKVIEEVRAGRNLIVQGPPGTGKSQTITNIIAAAAHDGKRVLFVAEKMAALGVVHERLVKVGLRDICLELHSRGSNKKAVLDEFRRTLNAGAAVPAVPSPPDKLKDARDRLNKIVSLVHQPIGETGETPFSALAEQARFAGAGSPPPSLSLDGLEKVDRLRANEIATEIQTYVELLAREGQECDHPFRGVRNLSLQPTDLARAFANIDEFVCRCEKVAAKFEKFEADLDWQVKAPSGAMESLHKLLGYLQKAPSVEPAFLCTLAAAEPTPELCGALDDGVKFQGAWRPISSRYSTEALDADIGELSGAAELGFNLFEIAAQIEALTAPMIKEESAAIRAIHGIPYAPLQSTKQYSTCDKIAVEFDKFAGYLDWQAEASFDAVRKLNELLGRLKEAPSVEPSFLCALAATCPTQELSDAIDTGVRYKEMWRAIAARYSSHALDTDIGALRTAVRRGCGSFWARLGPKFRKASIELERLLTSPSPKRAEDRLALLDALAEAQMLRAALRAKASFLEDVFKSHWRGENSDFAAATHVFGWLESLNKLGLSIKSEKAAELASNPQPLNKICDYFARAMPALEAVLQELCGTFNLDAKTTFRTIALKRVSFLAQIGAKYRAVSARLETLLASPLPERADARLALVVELRHVQQLRLALNENAAVLENALKSHWHREDTLFDDAASVLSWVKGFSELGFAANRVKAADLASRSRELNEVGSYFAGEERAIDSALRELVETFDINATEAFSADASAGAPFSDLASRFRELSVSRDRYDGWRRLQQSRAKLLAAQFDDLVAALGSGNLRSERAVTEFRYARAEAIWKRARRMSPELELLDDIDRHELVRQFQDLDRQRLVDVKTLILANHLASLPQGAVGQMGVIRGELGKQRRHKPIRQLISQASEAVQRIKPVFLMSPISVAQFLPPGKIEFDLLVIDEASQVRPEDALGAVARCKQIVVVGDQKQLPPTAFFDRLTSNVDNLDEDSEEDPLGGAASATELESILSLCEARGLPSRMLEWHYRSRDPSLIAVSNAEFYDHNLILPPSPLQHDPSYGLKFTRVNGAYDRGARRTNKIEAEALVKRVAEHAVNNAHLSLGIVAFSSAQRTAIEELLEFERRRNSALDALLREGKQEDVFVKNIENVQGDERDFILISIGYGPTLPGGRLSSMNFGPVNWDGGERRLNVLFTRARLRCEVFASFEPADIDLNRTTKTGPRVLKRYLEFAKTGILDEKATLGLDADSPFEEDVAEVIRGLGYEVDHQVGSGGFRIDLGVRNPDRPGQYILAVECDGATYHSALWARERDRLRQGILESLGWRFHRIWSTDWFYRRTAEITRLKSELETARQRRNVGGAYKGANN